LFQNENISLIGKPVSKTKVFDFVNHTPETFVSETLFQKYSQEYEGLESLQGLDFGYAAELFPLISVSVRDKRNYYHSHENKLTRQVHDAKVDYYVIHISDARQH
jgi:hypothetical protein